MARKRKSSGSPAPETNEEDDDDAASLSTDEGESGGSSSSKATPRKKKRKEFLNLNATFMVGVNGVTLVTEQVSTLVIIKKKMSIRMIELLCIATIRRTTRNDSENVRLDKEWISRLSTSVDGFK